VKNEATFVVPTSMSVGIRGSCASEFGRLAKLKRRPSSSPKSRSPVSGENRSAAIGPFLTMRNGANVEVDAVVSDVVYGR
jgi:hypothetical protein